MSATGFLYTCPNCAARFDLDVAVQGEYARRCNALLGEFPPAFVRPLILYLRLHKPPKKALSWSKIFKICSELLPMVKAARVERGGLVKVAPVELWVACVEQLLNDPPPSMVTPLKGNGYLLEIVSRHAERRLAQAEEQVEQERRRGSPAERATDAHEGHLQRMQDILKGQFPDDGSN